VNNLAYLYESVGRFDEAESLYEKSLSMRELSCGVDHPDTLAAKSALAGLDVFLRKYVKAEQLYKSCLEITERNFGQGYDCPDVLLALNNLATLYYKEERFEEASKLLHRAVELSANTLGAAHPSTEVLNNNYCAAAEAANVQKIAAAPHHH
jgi:tetratricopeptide (TPR) repeat protein